MGCRIPITIFIFMAIFIAGFDGFFSSTIGKSNITIMKMTVRLRNVTINDTQTLSNAESSHGPPTTDFFVMLPGKEMNLRNQQLYTATRLSVLELYDERYLHDVHNLGDASYLRRFPNASQREGHIVSNNNFALGAFAAAAEWMDAHRPHGNFVMLQHSTRLIARAGPPACDVELVNMRQRCGRPCSPPSQNTRMHTSVGTSACFPILNEVMGLYNETCGFPCCPWEKGRTIDHPYWPLMAHNAVLLTPRARGFLRPLIEYVRALPPGHVTKRGDQGTERLFGIFSSMLLRKYGPVRNESVAAWGKNYSNALEAYGDQIFLCNQDLTDKAHGNIKR